jgi:hypothetical protein
MKMTKMMNMMMLMMEIVMMMDDRDWMMDVDDDDDDDNDDDDGNDGNDAVFFFGCCCCGCGCGCVVDVDDDDDDDDDCVDDVVCTYFPRTRGLKWQQRTQHVPGTTVGTPMVMLPCELPAGDPLLSGGGGSSRLRWSIGDHHPNSETTNHLMWKSLIYYCEECHFA